MEQPVALITGASRGIGAATAELFARSGYAVAVNYFHSQQAALDLCQRLTREGFTAYPFPADVSSVPQTQAMAEAVLARWGRVDVLVNNAGIAQQKLFTHLSEEDWDQMFAVNTKSLFACCRAVVPHMLLEHRGAIVNLSSIWGQVGASCEVHYSASKAAVIGFTQALAKELGPSGIRVNCVSPGVILTQMNAALSPDTLEALRQDTPLELLGTPADVANAVLFLAQDGARFITGQVLPVNGGFVI